MIGDKNIECACQKYFLALTIPIERDKRDEGKKRRQEGVATSVGF